jgi:hypothetical protein
MPRKLCYNVLAHDGGFVAGVYGDKDIVSPVAFK